MIKVLKIVSLSVASIVIVVILNYFLINLLASPYINNNSLTSHAVGLVF